MAHTYALGQARTSSTGNPITFSYTVALGDTVICLMIKCVGGTDRAGGSPTWGWYTLTQADVTRKAVSSPEASCEVYYLLNPFPGTFTLTIPNTGASTLFYTVAIGRAKPGGSSAFDVSTGNSATSANPSPGTATVTTAGDIGFAITAGGWVNFLNLTGQAGTAIANSDDGANGGGEQYILDPAIGPHTLGWTHGTSDDWGAIAVYFKETAPHDVNNYKAISAVSDGIISVAERID